jgi:soluble lytic murein transglycosylase-like protein
MTLSRTRLAGGLAMALAWASPASAGVPHTVQPGETLWSIAAQNNFTTRSLAAANGLSETSQVVLGSTITIPSVGEAATALGSGAVQSTAGAGPGAPAPAGAYTVRPGDTLTAIAARSGVSPGQVAFMNGLPRDAHVISGTVLKLPTGSAPAAASSAPAPAPAPTVVPKAAPQATPGRVTSGEIGQIASAHGVSPSLASAVAWQESGFNNNLVSSANARGVMQVLPGTWSWVEGNIARRRIDAASPQENVHVGVMYLNRLIRDAGGDEARGVAGYYQGPASVARSGMFPDTQRYVKNVMALRPRFGGG